MSTYLALLYQSRTLFLRLLLETGPPLYVVHRAKRKSSRLLGKGTKAVPSFLSYFKTLSIGLVPGIKPTNSCSAVERSTVWANPAAVRNENVLKAKTSSLNKTCQFVYRMKFLLRLVKATKDQECIDYIFNKQFSYLPTVLGLEDS